MERALGTKLPAAYRQFLLEHNGGQPVPDLVDVEGLPGAPTDIQVFFGIDRSVESSNLAWNLRTFAGRAPQGTLPIACDSGGGLFCLSLAHADFGAVSYADVRQGQMVSYQVASDFAAFLGQLRD